MIKEYHHSKFLPLKKLVDNKKNNQTSVSAVIPALNEERTIGGIVSTIKRALMEEVGLVDEILVIDGGSDDRTAGIAADAGAAVFNAADIRPESVSADGKGVALWKSLFVTRGDIIVCIDADIVNFHERFVYGLAAPLLLDREIQFVKGAYRRPLQVDGELIQDYGGRVTEILVRPLLSMFYPDLSRIAQPLAGEYAFRREAIKKVPFSSGYGVEIGLLIDIFNVFGKDAFAQVDMDVRFHRNRSGVELGKMAFGILQTFLRKAENDDILKVARPFLSRMISRENDTWHETEINEKTLPPFEDEYP